MTSPSLPFPCCCPTFLCPPLWHQGKEQKEEEKEEYKEKGYFELADENDEKIKIAKKGAAFP